MIETILSRCSQSVVKLWVSCYNIGWHTWQWLMWFKDSIASFLRKRSRSPLWACGTHKTKSVTWVSSMTQFITLTIFEVTVLSLQNMFQKISIHHQLRIQINHWCDIAIFLLIFKFSSHWTIACIVSTANTPLVGALMTIGDVTKNIAIKESLIKYIVVWEVPRFPLFCCGIAVE